MALILIQTDSPAEIDLVRRHDGVRAELSEHATALDAVVALLRELPNAQLGWLKLHGVGREQRRRVERLPGPQGAPGSNVVRQVN